MKNQLKFLVILFVWIGSNAFGQNGEALFKSKCSTCHSLKQKSTGPMLQGVKQKWIEAEEGEMIYEWVTNSEMLINSGRSKMAKAIEGFSPSVMSPQDANKEEVDAILDYVDNWTPPVAVEAGTVPGEVEVITVPNYHNNLMVFYALITMIFVLLIAIAMLSGAIKRYIGSDYFKSRLASKEAENTKREKGSGGLTNLILVITSTLFIAQNSNALEFMKPGDAIENQPWLLVETYDLYALVILNILLLGVLLYMKRLFNGFVEMVSEEKETEEIAPAVLTKVGKLLTDVVPIDEEESILLHHEYDGIRELDNNLPPWWVWLFYGTIIFAVVYLFNYHVLGISDLQIEAYKKEMILADQQKEAYRKAMAMNVDETNATVMTEASDLSTGKQLFAKNCVSCHGANGEGVIGPNLTDNAWIYGYDIKELYKTVRVGSPNGKMPEHESKMNPIEIQQVVSFVLSMPDAKGAEPLGDIIQK